MRVVVECTEPQARPLKRACNVHEGEEVALYVLPLLPDTAGLRRTALRYQHQHPPTDARLVMWLQATTSGMTVVEVGQGLTVEMLRSDVRSQVVAGMRVSGTASFEISLPDRTRIAFSLSSRQPMAKGAMVGVAGSGIRSSRVIYAADNVFWLITDGPGIIVVFWVKMWDAIRDKLAKAGIDNRVFSFASGLLIAGIGVGLLAWQQHRAAQAAEARAADLEEQAAAAQAARDASLQTELVCIQDRQALAGKLGEAEESRRQAVIGVLQPTASSTLATEAGSRRLRSPPPELVRRDVSAQSFLVEALVRAVEDPPSDLSPCLDDRITSVLKPDLPRYLLIWHTDPDRACTASTYTRVDGDSTHIGRWGLSDRLAREFGRAGNGGLGTGQLALADIVSSDVLSDPRSEDRWSAFTLAAAYRTILKAVIGTDAGSRPSVLPSQAQLWALAFLDGYARMPSPAGGARDAPAADCVQRAILERAANAPPATSGEAVLPDIIDVASGDVSFEPTPTPGCMWPERAIADGVKASFTAVGRLAASDLAGPPK